MPTSESCSERPARFGGSLHKQCGDALRRLEIMINQSRTIFDLATLEEATPRRRNIQYVLDQINARTEIHRRQLPWCKRSKPYLWDIVIYF